MSANEAVARVNDFIAKSPGVLVIKTLGPKGPQKLNVSDLVAAMDELNRLRGLMRDPAVAAVVELAEECERQARRAEAAHEQKDEANRRWLEATTKGDGRG